MARNGIYGSSEKGMVVVVRETRILLQYGMNKRHQGKEGKVPSDELVIWAMAWCTTINIATEHMGKGIVSSVAPR